MSSDDQSFLLVLIKKASFIYTKIIYSLETFLISIKAKYENKFILPLQEGKYSIVIIGDPFISNVSHDATFPRPPQVTMFSCRSVISVLHMLNSASFPTAIWLTSKLPPEIVIIDNSGEHIQW